MNKAQKTGLMLSALTVYRNLLKNELIAAYTALLEAVNGPDLRGFTAAYGRFMRALSARSEKLDFGEAVGRLTRYDDNAFTRAAAAAEPDKIDALVLGAAGSDLAALHAAAGLTSAGIKMIAIENFGDDPELTELMTLLPDYQSGTATQADPFGLVEEQARFHRQNGCGIFACHGAFKWVRSRSGENLYGVANPDLITLGELKGYEYERGLVVANTQDFIGGDSANNLLLYGDRGTGKSSTVKAVFNQYRSSGLRIIEVTRDCIADFPLIVRQIAGVPLKFILFIDDLSFASDDSSFSALKAVLEGGLATRPKNCVIYATSNRRHLVRETFSERDNDDVHAGDTMQEKLSLSDRFGITVTFSAPDQNLYFKIIGALARDRGLEVPKQELERGAVQWALRFNGRSPRAARQYIDWAQSRVKKGLPVTDF